MIIKKRIFGVIIAAVLICVMIPSAKMKVEATEEWIEVSTCEEMKTALNRSDANVRLISDITYKELPSDYGISIGSGNYVLDMNGHGLSVDASSVDTTYRTFTIRGNLTLKNSMDSPSIIAVKFSDYESYKAIFRIFNGTFTVENDNIMLFPYEGKFASAIMVDSGGSACVKGGIIGTGSSASGISVNGAGAKLDVTGGRILGIKADKDSEVSLSECEVLSEQCYSGGKFINYNLNLYHDYRWLAPGQNIYINGLEQDLTDPNILDYATKSWEYGIDGSVVTRGDTITISDGRLLLPENDFGSCGHNLSWNMTKSSGELVISGTGSMYDYTEELAASLYSAPWHRYKDLIKSVKIEEGVTYIGNYAFDECSRITNFEVPWSVKSLGTSICDCDSGMNSFFKVKYYGSELQWKRMVEASGSNNELKEYDYFDFRSYGGKIGDNVYWNLNNDDNKLIIYGSGPMYDSWDRSDTSLHFTDFNTRDIEEAIIEEGVTTIGEEAFVHRYSSNIKKLYVAASVTEIKTDAFYYSTKLNEVIFAPSSRLKSIGEYAFSNTGLTNAILPQGLETIGDAAFYESELEKVTIPTTVTSIGSGAFNDTNLKSVIFLGTQEQWKQINIDSNNPNLFNLVEGFAPPHSHSGGIATCKKKAICEICGEEYGEVNPGNHDFSKCVSNGDGTHKVMCKDCDTVQEGHDKDACSGGTATCTKKAVCEDCGEEYGKLAEHTLKTTTTTKATLTADGKKETKCTVCGKVTKTTKIYAAKTIKLSKTTYAYDGKAKKPTVTVKDSKGKAIATTNYSVKYDDGRKNVGKYNVKTTFKGDYKGSKTLTFTINPKATTLKSVTPDSKAFTAKWTKQTKQVDGYEVEYALDDKFTSSAKVAVTKNTTTSKKISSLKAKKTYYVRVRTYKKVGTKKYYSDWSKVLSVKTK